MKAERFYPYHTAPGGISLHLDAEGIHPNRSSDGSLQFYDPSIKTVTLRASAALSSELLGQVVSSTELDKPPVDVRLVYRSIESRRRGFWPLRGDGGVYEGTITLRREDWIDAVNIQAILVRTAANASLPSMYGADHGSVLAWSEPIRVLFDEASAPPGRNIEVMWISFNEDPRYPRLRQYAGQHLFALDTQGQTPRLLLNQDITGAYTILGSMATHGATARIRDATYFLIAHQVWSSLLATALRYLSDTADTDQGTMPDMSEVPEGWQRNILRDWAPYLFPEYDPDGALEQLQSSVTTASGSEDILGRMANAIQARFQTFKGFEGLVREIDRI